MSTDREPGRADPLGGAMTTGPGSPELPTSMHPVGDTPQRRMRRFLCDCGRWVSVTSNKPYEGRFDLRAHRHPSGGWCTTLSVPATGGGE